MRKAVVVLMLLYGFSSCKVAQDPHDIKTLPRFDGVYIADDVAALAVNSDGNPLKDVRNLVILRFYDKAKGVIVPVRTAKHTVMSDSLTKQYWQWAQDFEKAAPEKKDMVNFTYRMEDDSLFFESKSPDIAFIYDCECMGDSILCDQVISAPEQYGVPDKVVRKYKFIFHPVKNEREMR